MPRATLTHRVETLEHTMSALSDLPARVGRLESRLAEFREEARSEFAAVRQEMAEGFAAVPSETRAGDEETRRQMLILHEDLVSRIKVMGEGIDDLRQR